MKTSLLALGIAAAAAPAFAQTPAPAPDAASVALPDEAGTIVVTATRQALPIDQVSAAVTVLDKLSIDRTQDLVISDLIARTPGIALSRNGGYGTATTLRIRGAESDQTVVVIDGVKLNDPSLTGGGYNFGNLLINDASRVEILRGPQSILWGSQAIGGVVNIVTPLATRPLEGSFDLETGSRQTASARAGLGGKTGPVAWRIGAQAFTTDGISTIAPQFGGKERDGYTNQSVNARALTEIAPGLSLDLRGYYSNARADLDGFGADSSEYSLNRELVGYAGINLDLLGGRFRNRFGYGYTDIDRANYDPTSPSPVTFDAKGRNHRLEYQGTFAITNGISALFGVDNERSRFNSSSPSFSPLVSRGRARLTGVYAQLNVEPVAGLTLNGGIRRDDHNQFGGKTVFSGGGVWALPTGTRVRANYSEGFKAPSLYQLYSEYGNGVLRPELAKGWEAGVEQHVLGDRLTVGATWFQRRSTNLIGYFSCSFTSTNPLCFAPGSTSTRRFGYYANIARAFTRGIEASASAKLGEHLTVDGNYTWTETEDRAAGTTTFGRDLPRRPRHTANGSVSYGFGEGGSVGAAVRYSGRSYENASNATVLGAYTLVDLRGELPLSDTVRVFARIENLFDEHYMTAYQYGSLGRSIYAGFRGRF